MSDYYFSFIMAAYNSESTIEKALRSIREQEFDQNKIEILVIDGGSTDSTVEIAVKYNAVVINNPFRLPEPAKMIGLKRASGKYICIMDSDEVIRTNKILKQREKVLNDHDELSCLAIGLITPKNSDPCCYYINAVGDPFSCFVYGTFKGSMEGLIIKKSKIYDDDCYIAKYRKTDIKPIGDSGTVMELKYIISHYGDQLDSLTTATIFDKMIEDTGYVGFINGDKHYHYTSASFSAYFRKLKFRIINNIHSVNESGYSSKAAYNKKLSLRKYLFVPYTCSIILPIIDGIRMMFNYKHWIFLLHPVFAWYVLVEIMIQYSNKFRGKEITNATYGVDKDNK